MEGGSRLHEDLQNSWVAPFERLVHIEATQVQTERLEMGPVRVHGGDCKCSGALDVEGLLCGSMYLYYSSCLERLGGGDYVFYAADWPFFEEVFLLR